MIVKQMSLILITSMVFWSVPSQEAVTLVSSDPPAQSTIREPTQRITMEFSEPIEDGSFVVTAASGGVVAPEEVVIDESGVTLGYPAGLPDGGYEVAWQVTGLSGATGEGVFSFTLRLPPANLRFVTPRDGQTQSPGALVLDVALQGIDLEADGTEVQFQVDGETITTSNLPTVVKGLEPGIYTIDGVVLQAGTPLETTREQVTVVLAEPPPLEEPLPETVEVAPPTGAEAIASVVGVIVLLVVGIVLEARGRSPN